MHWTNQPVGKDAFVLTGTARHQQSRKFLECFCGNFLTRVTEHLTSWASYLEMREKETEMGKSGAAFAAVTWEPVSMNKEQDKKQDYEIRIQESKFWPTEQNPMQRRVHRRDWCIFQDHLCQAQDWPEAICRKLGKGNRLRTFPQPTFGNTETECCQAAGPWWVLRELANNIVRPLLAIFERLWWLRMFLMPRKGQISLFKGAQEG